MTSRLSLLVGLLVSLAASSAAAQPAFLVKDIRSGTLPAQWPDGAEFVEMGGFAYFLGYDRIQGSELWRSDGTAAGTTLVRDVCPGVCSSTPSELTVVGTTIYFRADDGAHGPSLWKSDGTQAGTALVKAVEPSRLTAFGSLLAFAASSPSQGQELWRSDGTAAGTLSLGDLRPGPQGSSPNPLGELAGGLLFNADDGTNGRELWKTDGTVSGTALVEDIHPGSDSGLPFIEDQEGSAEVGGKLLFRAVDGSGQTHLWGSDGTASGTAKVHDVSPSPDFSKEYARFVKVGDHVFFSDGGAVWKSDGTGAGTVPASGSLPSPSELTAVDNRLFFKSADFFFPYAELFVSDGTEAGTAQVPLPSGISISNYGSNGFRPLGSELVFFAGNSTTGGLWKTDGTEDGTVLLTDFQSGMLPTITGEGLYFFRAPTSDGWELWASDGTPAGTGSVKRLDASDASGLTPEIELENALGMPISPLKADLAGTLLLAGLPEDEIWRSDGTEAGTVLVKELVSGVPFDLTPFDGRIFFSASNLWSTDGTEAGTVSYSTSLAHHLTPLGGQLYVAASGFTEEIVKIGPSEPDVTQVKSLLYTGLLQQLTAAGPRLYFLATGIGGYVLWTSDGTEAGSHRVKDIRPGSGFSNPSQITSAGSFVFFVADDGTAGEELWKSDGTEAGTVLVADIRSGAESSWIREITAVGDRVFFVADDGIHGVELWVSDGSAAGTHMVKDAVPGAGSSYPRYMEVAGHLLYFAADDGTHGLEPWKTDGTEAGTAMLQDVNPGEEPSTPTGFLISGPYLYFTANDGTHGFELWALDRAADYYTLPPCRVFDTRSTSSLASSASRTFTVAGTCGVPAGAQALAVNLTVIDATGNGRVVVYPAGPNVPSTSSLNFQAGVTRANNAVIGLTAGQVDALATVVGGGTVHLVLDVTGYYQ